MKTSKGIVFMLFLIGIFSIALVPIASAVANDTKPKIDNVDVNEITNSSAKITFTVNQSDAHTYVNYDTRNPANRVDRLRQQSDPNNDISETRTIILSGLTSNKKYYYSVHAANGSDSNKFSDSSILSFTTNETVIPTPTPTSTPSADNKTWMAPYVDNIQVLDTTSSTANISFRVNQSNADTRINYGTSDSQTLGTWSDWNKDTGKSRKIMLKNLLNDTKYNFSIYAYNRDNNSYYNNSEIESFTTKNNTGGNNNIGDNNIPGITETTPEKNKITETGQSVDFVITFDQTVDITWYLNGDKIQENKSVTTADYLNMKPSVGRYNITASGKNKNGTISYSWNWTVRAPLSNTGNRVWDGTKGMATTYIWNSYSFSGFYYDLDNNISTEQLIIKNIRKTIDRGDIEYSTSPTEVDFEHSNFGKYQVIGFMASKYFAGYTANSTFESGEEGDEKSVIGSGQLQKVLIDDDDKRTVSVGGTLTLEEGYVLKMKEIDTGVGKGQIWVVLLKDGSDVDDSVVSANENYVYSKKVGNVDNLPIIVIHFDSVFRGKEVDAAFIKGVFQISETATSIKSGDEFGKMEISGVGSDKITMENSDDLSLSRDSTIDLMGDLKIMVADNDTLRFALAVDKGQRTGELEEKFEIRGTIYPVVKQWTPMNFGLNFGDTNIGFYYDIDEDIGTESLTLESISGNSIPDGKLKYSTSPQEVSFQYSNFGKYQVIGFMADKYFAGYTENTKPPNPSTGFGDRNSGDDSGVSFVAQGELHKVVLDDDKKRTVSIGGTLSLKDGYVLKAIDIDQGARTMLISLLKDGEEIEQTPLSAGQTYVYAKKVGSVDNVPLIMARFDSVFSGEETQAAFIKGLFQISEEYISIKADDKHGKMRVDSFDKNGITMENDGSIGVSSGSSVEVMGNISFKVADSNDDSVRFYPFVTVTSGMVEISSNQLTIVDLPTKIKAGENLNVKVTAGGIAIDGATVSINNTDIGKTNITGYFNYSLPKIYKGKYNVTVAKMGYQNITKTIEVQEYIEGKLSINVSMPIDQFETITIKTLSNSTPVGGVTVVYDNVTIGMTNDLGIINYTVDSSGPHTIFASKNNYVPISQDIEVRAPFSEFKALDINITPIKIFENEKIIVRSNITNIGTKADTKSIELFINGSVVNNQTIELSPKETKEINFTYKTLLTEGNYSVEILEQKQLLEVNKAPMNILLILAVLIVIGAITIYIATEKERFSGLLNNIRRQKKE